MESLISSIVGDVNEGSLVKNHMYLQRNQFFLVKFELPKKYSIHLSGNTLVKIESVQKLAKVEQIRPEF